MSNATTEVQQRQDARFLREIEALSVTDIGEELFLTTFAKRALSATGAASVLVWLSGGNGRLAPVANAGPFSEEPGNTDDDRVRRQLRDAVLQNGEYHAAPLGRGDRLLREDLRQVLAAPLHAEERPGGVIEALFVEPQSDGELQAAAAFLEDAGLILAHYFLWREESRNPAQQLDFWKRFEDALWRIYGSLHPLDVATQAANEGRSLLWCDRLSIALQRGKNTTIAATSGVSQVKQRALVPRSMSRLAAAVAESGESLTYTGREMDLPPQIEPLLVDFVLGSGARLVKVIPLLEAVRNSKPGSPRGNAGRPAAVLGAMIVEQMDRASLSPLQSQRADLLASHVARALSKAEAHHRVFLLPARDYLGRTLAALLGDRSRRWGIAALFAAVATLFMCVIPASYTVQAKGRLMPTGQQHIYAPIEGQVIRVFVHSGDRVRAGDRLIEMRNDRIATELLVAKNELREKRQAHESLRAQIDAQDGRSVAPDEIQPRGQLLKLEIEIRGLQKQIELLERDAALLNVRAPIAGTVVTFQVEQSLLGRPVDRGHLLLDLMDVQGAWQLELAIPEKRAGAIFAARGKASDGALPVEFLVGTAPEKNYRATLREVGTSVDSTDLVEPFLPAWASIPPGSLAEPRVGAEIDAKISCGYRALIHVLFGDFIDFVRRNIW